MTWQPKKTLLLTVSGALLVFGSALLIQQIHSAWQYRQAHSTQLSIRKIAGNAADLQGAFPATSVDNYFVQHNGKDVFNLLIAHYQDAQKQQRRAVLFPKAKVGTGIAPSPIELRQAVWQAAAAAIKQNTQSDALILSWWDDGQRIHFLSGRNAWLTKPGEATFKSSVWKNLESDLLLADATEHDKLAKMAGWLTMDSEKALAEMRQTFATSKLVYLVVNNDLLMRVAEMADYGGTKLSLKSKTVAAHDNLHADISQIRQWANEEGEGNYLVQKEGGNYHLWVTPKSSVIEKNALLVRLLPFVDSLKKLPSGVRLVYQSNWGGYLSIYQIDLNSKK